MPPVLTPAVFFAAFVGTCVVVVPVAMYASSSAPPSPPQPTAPPDPVKCTGHMFSNEEPELEDVSDLFVINNESRVQLNVPPRYMWGWGGTVRGYCGAGSLQSSALYFGTWISQQYPRWAAGNDSSPAYLGKAAQTFRLTVDNFDTKLLPNPQADIFLQWTQAHILLGHVVIGGLYAKFHRSFTDLEFDHIVPIIGVTMDDDEFQYADDDSGKINITTNVTGVLYNDLDDEDYRRMHSPLAALRADFIVPENISNVFPIKYAIPEYADFGLAVTGVMDTFGETYRTKLTAWSWTEPDWGTEDGCNETAEEMFVSISVYGLTPGRVYSILRFEGNTSIPTSNFLGSRNYTKRWNFVARSSTYVQSPLDIIMTDLLVSYRTVLSDVQNLTRTRSQSKTRSASRMLTITPEVTKSITKINSPPDNATKAPPPSRGAVRGSFWLQGARGRLITHRNTNTPDDRSPQQPPSEPDVMVACAELAVCAVAAAFFIVRRYGWTRTAYHTWFKTNGRNAPSSPSSAAFDLA